MNRKQRRTLKSRGIAVPDTSQRSKIQNKYGQACAKAGEIQYQRAVLAEELEKVNEEIKILNKQFSEILQEESKATDQKNQEKPQEVANVQPVQAQG